jgi:hypothetical protein
MPQRFGWPTIGTMLVALYGALLSTYNVVADWRRKKRVIKLSFASGLAPGTWADHKRAIRLYLTAANAGHRPIMVRSFGLILPNGTKIRFPVDGSEVPLPYELTEGSSCVVWADDGEVGEYLARNGYEGSVWVTPYCEDGLGVHHLGEKFSAKGRYRFTSS